MLLSLSARLVRSLVLLLRYGWSLPLVGRGTPFLAGCVLSLATYAVLLFGSTMVDFRFQVRLSDLLFPREVRWFWLARNAALPETWIGKVCLGGACCAVRVVCHLDLLAAALWTAAVVAVVGLCGDVARCHEDGGFSVQGLVQTERCIQADLGSDWTCVATGVEAGFLLTHLGGVLMDRGATQDLLKGVCEDWEVLVDGTSEIQSDKMRKYTTKAPLCNDPEDTGS